MQVDGRSNSQRAAALLAAGRTGVKVADFGLSVALPGNMSHQSDTRRGTPYAPPRFASCLPETPAHAAISCG